LSVSVRWNRSARSGRGSGEDLRIARWTASSYARLPLDLRNVASMI